jgi:hypothetical protein
MMANYQIFLVLAGIRGENFYSPLFGEEFNFFLHSPRAFFSLLLGLLSLVFLAGRFKFMRWGLLLFWFLWIHIFGLDGQALDVSFGYLGFLCLVVSLYHEEMSDFGKKILNLDLAMWVIFGVSYTVSGIFKISSSVSWRQGKVLEYILKNDINLRFPQIEFNVWDWLLQMISYSGLALEILAVVVVFKSPLRIFFFWALTILQLGLWVLLDLGLLTPSVLVFHCYFLFALHGKKINEIRLIFISSMKRYKRSFTSFCK